MKWAAATVGLWLLPLMANASPHVTGYERFYAKEASITGGALLYSELGCANCHGSSPVAVPRKGPSLENLSVWTSGRMTDIQTLERTDAQTLGRGRRPDAWTSGRSCARAHGRLHVYPPRSFSIFTAATATVALPQPLPQNCHGPTPWRRLQKLQEKQTNNTKKLKVVVLIICSLQA